MFRCDLVHCGAECRTVNCGFRETTVLLTMQDLIEADDVPLWRLIAIALQAAGLRAAFLLATFLRR